VTSSREKGKDRLKEAYFFRKGKREGPYRPKKGGKRGKPEGEGKGIKRGGASISPAERGSTNKLKTLLSYRKGEEKRDFFGGKKGGVIVKPGKRGRPSIKKEKGGLLNGGRVERRGLFYDQRKEKKKRGEK